MDSSFFKEINLMFLSKVLGIEDSFLKSLIYVFCLFVFYTVFGSIVYVTLVGVPMIIGKFGKLSDRTTENNIVE